jgi:structure-specific endonuclease subunit SLX1
VNPRRRIRQHNGEIANGALRTHRGRLWEMVLCIYDFTSNVAALQVCTCITALNQLGDLRAQKILFSLGRESGCCVLALPTEDSLFLCVHLVWFEWAWQHPTESLAVRKVAAEFNSLDGISNKVKLAYTMLNLPSWEK